MQRFWQLTIATLIGITLFSAEQANAQMIMRIGPGFGPMPMMRAEMTPFGAVVETPMGTAIRPRYGRPYFYHHDGTVLHRGRVYHQGPVIHEDRVVRRRSVYQNSAPYQDGYAAPARAQRRDADVTSPRSIPTPVAERQSGMARLDAPAATRALRDAAVSLDNNLADLRHGAGWQSYLRTKELIDLIPQAQPLGADQRVQLQRVLDQFAATANTPEFRRVTEVAGFQQAQAALADLLARQPVVASNERDVRPASDAGDTAGKEISVLTKSSRQATEELPSPDASQSE